jgi:hypothetical protein
MTEQVGHPPLGRRLGARPLGLCKGSRNFGVPRDSTLTRHRRPARVIRGGAWSDLTIIAAIHEATAGGRSRARPSLRPAAVVESNE